MKKFWLVVAAILGVGLLIAGIILWQHLPSSDSEIEDFSLDESDYGTGQFQEITAAEFATMQAAGRSFIVVIHMAVCPAEFPLTDTAKQLAQNARITIYGLKEDEFKQTELAAEIKYLPSAAVIHDGELIAFLDAGSDVDLEYYRDVVALRRWLALQGVEL